MNSWGSSLVAGLALFGAALGPGPAAAEGAPRDITPSPYLDPEALPPPEPEDATPGSTENGDLESSELSPLDTGAIGTLSEMHAGYPATLWQGSRPARVITLISGMAGATSFPAANAMARKVLLSAAPLPAGDEVSVGVEPYLFARLERLNATGDLGSALFLFEQIPRTERSMRTQRLMVNAYLLDGDFETACGLAEAGQREEGTAEWLKIAAVCYALKGDAAAARLTLSLLEEGGEADPAFANLLEDVIARVAGTPEPTPDTAAPEADAEAPSEQVPTFFERSPYLASELTPLTVALLKLFAPGADVDLSSGAPSNLMLAALARWAGLPLETKMKVADLALERGVLDQAFLSDLAAAYRFTPEDKVNPYLLDYQTWGLKGDALFYALSLEARELPDATRFLREGWERARSAGRAAFIAPLYLKALKRIPADRERLEFVPDAVRIYLLNGEFIRALGWYNVALNAAAAGDPEATRILVEAWPLMVSEDTTGAIPFSPDILELWSQSLGLLPADEREHRRAYFMNVLSALGIPEAAPAEAPNPLLGPSLGETVLQCLSALGREGPEPKVLRDIMTALIHAGLDGDARALALETLLAKGF
jgi:hypothetical protein